MKVALEGLQGSDEWTSGDGKGLRASLTLFISYAPSFHLVTHVHSPGWFGPGMRRSPRDPSHLSHRHAVWKDRVFVKETDAEIMDDLTSVQLA